MTNHAQRRARPSCSPELETIVKFVVVFSPDDLLFARALNTASFQIAGAAKMLRITAEAARQRLCTLVRRIQAVVPEYALRQGAHAREISYDQFDGMGAAIGVTDGRSTEES